MKMKFLMGAFLILFFSKTELTNGNQINEFPLHIGQITTIPELDTAWFAYGEHYDRIENIVRGHEPAHFTYIYSDGVQYYYDSGLECLLPDGYYSSDYYGVYKFEGGYLVQTLTIPQCSTCPYPILPYIPDPFVPCSPQEEVY